MNKRINKGSYSTIITPYLENGKIDFETVKKYVKWYGDNGCTGIFSVCQSSEIEFLSGEETALLNKTVCDAVSEYNRYSENKLSVVSSGHVSDSIEEQARELNIMAESGTDAVVWITNRLDPNNEGDDVWLKNAEALIKQLPEDIDLGLYECPRPYKRLVSPRILEWCKSTGRFTFMKDTCCDSALIKERIKVLEGSDFGLYNANCQTLLTSLKDGAAGYCGIMLSFHPRLYGWLCNNFEREPEKAELIQSFLCTAGYIENWLPYPLSGKYGMCLNGNPTLIATRKPNMGELTDYGKDCIAQMQKLSNYFENIIRGE